MMPKHLDIRELITLIKETTSTSYTEALIDGLKLAIELDRGEITVKTAFKEVLRGSKRYVSARTNADAKGIEK